MFRSMTLLVLILRYERPDIVTILTMKGAFFYNSSPSPTYAFLSIAFPFSI
jgi:hypothetical protein